MKTQTELFRELPAIDELLREPEISQLSAEEGQSATTDACREVLARLRDEISAGHLDAERLRLALTGIHAAIRDELSRSLGYSLKAVINATGVVLHTNLGRAPLARSAIEHIRETADAYSNLEFDIESGDRGKRDVHVDRLFRKLLSREHAAAELTKRAGASVPSEFAEGGGTGVLARAAASVISTIVVNNNAAAVLLALNTLAEGGEVIVSRGELVEIGGSFRVPDVMAKSGATLREVGTTNRTRVADYESAINERTRALLRVHRSNFEITGFTERPALADLAKLARARNIPLLEDLGSGAIVDLRTFGISGEPNVLDSLHAAVDVVTYSGDKLLGGPQSGLLSGRADLITRMRKNSLFRALRVDKLTYAALAATLLAYVKHDHAAIPALRMMRLTKQEIAARAEALVQKLRSTAPKWELEIIDGESVVGGGAAPSAVLPTRLIAMSLPGSTTDWLSARLRRCDPPIVARVEDGRVLLDLRTVFPEQDRAIADAVQSI